MLHGWIPRAFEFQVSMQAFILASSKVLPGPLTEKWAFPEGTAHFLF